MTATTTRWKAVPTSTVEVGGVPFAYRDFGNDVTGVPVIFLHHFIAVLDDWDPRVLDTFGRTIA